MLNEITKIKKKTLEKKLEKLLATIRNDIEPLEAIKIYENLIITIGDSIEKNENSSRTCNSCGESLKEWEKEICGPCKIKDDRYPEERED